jgi:proline iminopeptidase
MARAVANGIKTAFRELYPSIEPYSSGFLQVTPRHSIYWEVAGNPKGAPVLFVHGGPGGGIGPDDRRYFEPKTYRIVLFDQRGAGRSKPSACLENNNTWSLVDDMESIRKHLQIEKWILFGGSWGSTLSLSYAITHPDRTAALVLRGIFLLRDSEIKWFYEKVDLF